MLNKIQMKKKHRRAVYAAIILPLYILILPFALIGILCEYILDAVTFVEYWLKHKLRVSKYDD